MVEVASLVMTADTTGLKKGTEALKGLEAQAVKTEAAVADVATASTKTTAAAAKGGNASRVFAQQLSQVAQQGAVTGNYLGALAVQLPDIAGGLTMGASGAGAMAIKIGGISLAMSTLLPALSIAAMIAIPALQNAFGGGKSAAEKLTESVDKAKEAVGRMESAARASTQPMAELAMKYGLAASEAQRFLRTIADAEALNAMTAVQEEIAAIAGSMGDLVTKVRGQNVLTEVGVELGMTVNRALAIQRAIDAVGAAQGLEAKASAAAALHDLLFQIYGTLERMPEQMRQLAVETATAAEQAARIQNPIDKALAALSRVFSMDAAGGWLSNAISRVETLAAKAWAAAQGVAAASLTGSVPALAGPAGMASGETPAGVRAAKLAADKAAADKLIASIGQTSGSTSGGHGGGGGSAVSALTDAQKAAQDLADTINKPVVSAVDGLANAFGDFVAGGLQDFKGFVKSVLSSFTGMLSQMIATAARNKIMLSLGMTGAGAGGALAGVAGAASGGGLGLGGIMGGIGKSFGALASGGGFMAALPALGIIGAGIGLISRLFGHHSSGPKLASGAQDAYYSGFYSDQERTAMQTAALQEQMAKLGVTMPATREGFRALVDGVDTSTKAGQALKIQLLNMAQAMDAVLPKAGEITNALLNTRGPTWRNYAAGGTASGIYSVGEAGRELVATGRARVLNASQTREALSGNSAQETAALRAENRQLMIALNTTMRKQLDLFKKWDATGLSTVTA